jgi:hypothetical protein
MTKGSKFFNIGITCTLPEEAEAVIAEISIQYQASFYQSFGERWLLSSSCSAFR